MKKLLFFSALAAMTLVACQSYDTELPMPDDEAALTAVQKEEITQITEDVNSGEVKNILGSLFGKQRKGRSADYTVSLLKDKQGVDRVICINYADNGGFALISAEKTHSPILAYADEGNFTVTDSLPFPLSEWMDCTMHSIAESESLPADSLETIARMWRKYDSGIMPLVDDYPSEGGNIPWEEYYQLTRIVMDKMAEWSSLGYRYYPIDDYNGTISLGDKNGIASFVQGIMYPPYVDDYRTLTFVVEKDIEYTTGRGHWLKTNWSQFNGYNQSFPTTTDNITGHIPVGCGPIAVGQLMYAYQYPSYFNWSEMTVSGTGNKITSDFLLDVKNKCKAFYNPETGGTGCYQKNMVEALRGYGYRCDDNTSINTVQMLNNPSILISYLCEPGVPKLEGDCHAWIVEGGRCTVTNMQTEVWAFSGERNFNCVFSESTQEQYSSWVFYVNWGWGRSTDAYYNLDPMLPTGYGYQNNYIVSGIQNIRPF